MCGTATAVDRFTHHSDVTIKRESAGEFESEIEQQKELGLINHTPDTVGLSPQEEFSPSLTFFRENNILRNFNKVNSHTSESFHHTESNKQSGTSSSLEEVMHELKGHAISSEREVSIAFVPAVHGSIAWKKQKKKKVDQVGTPTGPKSVSARGERNDQQQYGKIKSMKETQ
ncbi:MAG: hypothetical protein EZS28_045169 [Streblomastix strix]|uniref:Uncharacterized protein n=1 Tax=Streblomastix strix TaxID=222440 RepID=A0A5J4TLM9_9EUKA|nr:MAG: hypothetical protein EZS28_045169 [Streblomastix strix]